MPGDAAEPDSMHRPRRQRPPPQKKSAGRDLRAAIGVGVGLGAVIVASLFVVKAVFVGVIVVAVVVGLWELTSRLEERKGIKAPLVPLARRRRRHGRRRLRRGAPRAPGWRWRSPRSRSWSGG